MGVIDKNRDSELAPDLLQPARDRLQPGNPLRDCALRQPQSKTNAYGAQDIFQIGRPDQPRRKIDYLVFHADLSSKTIEIPFELQRVDIPLPSPAITHNLKPQLPDLIQKFPTPGVSSVNNSKLILLGTRPKVIRKKPALSGKISLHIHMEIEMVARQIGK